MRARIALPSAVLALVLLAGCSAGGGDRTDLQAGAAPKAAGPGAATDGSTAGGGEEGDLADGVGYDEVLADGVTVEWTDVFFVDPDFTVDSPDDGEGRWSYTRVSNGCTVSFWQTEAGGIAPGADEIERSDATIAQWLGFDIAEVQEYSFDTSIAIAGADGASFDARAVVGSGDDDDWITVARTFNGSDQSLAVDITCPAGTSAEDELAALTPDYIAARVS